MRGKNDINVSIGRFINDPFRAYRPDNSFKITAARHLVHRRVHASLHQHPLARRHPQLEVKQLEQPPLDLLAQVLVLIVLFDVLPKLYHQVPHALYHLFVLLSRQVHSQTEQGLLDQHHICEHKLRFALEDAVGKALVKGVETSAVEGLLFDGSEFGERHHVFDGWDVEGGGDDFLLGGDVEGALEPLVVVLPAGLGHEGADLLLDVAADAGLPFFLASNQHGSRTELPFWSSSGFINSIFHLRPFAGEDFR